MILLLCTLALLDSVLGLGCEQGWHGYDKTGKCYKVLKNYWTDLNTWEDAENICQAEYGGHLVSIHSPDENNFVYGLLDKGVFNATSAWIGIHKTNGVYEWTDGSRVNYSNWYYGVLYGDCGLMAQSYKGGWISANCDTRIPFVCQLEVNKCGDGWSKDSETGSCYKVLSDELSWQDAREQCMSLDIRSDLASIHTDKENEFVKNLLKENDTTPGVQGYWTGGNDIKDEGSWVWTDGSPVEFADWHNGQGKPTKNKDCIAMWKSFGYKWKDWQCKMTLPSICKIENKK